MADNSRIFASIEAQADPDKLRALMVNARRKSVTEVYDAAFRRAGLLRVTELEDLFEAAETLARLPRIVVDCIVSMTCSTEASGTPTTE